MFCALPPRINLLHALGLSLLVIITTRGAVVLGLPSVLGTMHAFVRRHSAWERFEGSSQNYREQTAVAKEGK